jgi:hypothetical protein
MEDEVDGGLVKDVGERERYRGGGGGEVVEVEKVGRYT